MATVQTYVCPACGAALKYSIEKQLWACEYCLNEYNLEQLQEQHAESLVEEAYEDAPPHFSTGAEYDQAAAIAFTCPSCGGSIITEKNTTATFCPFCHNPTIIASRLERQHRPVKLIPFKQQKDDVLAAMKKFCKRRPLLPKAFRQCLAAGEITGLYVPYWLFSAELDGTVEGRGTKITTWMRGDYQYTKTDVYRVKRSGRMDFANLPADGSERLDDRLMEGMEPYDDRELNDFAMEYLSGHFAESYDVDSEGAGRRAFQRMKQGISQSLRQDIHGYNRVDILRDESRVLDSSNMYVLFPVWLLSIKYKDKIRMFAMNGQTGKITGLLPLSVGRLLAWFGGLFALASALSFVVLYFIR